jgi:hypothetical protein
LPTDSHKVVWRASDGHEFTDSLAAWGLVQDADGDQLVVPMVLNEDGLGAFGYLDIVIEVTSFVKLRPVSPQ